MTRRGTHGRKKPDLVSHASRWWQPRQCPDGDSTTAFRRMRTVTPGIPEQRPWHERRVRKRRMPNTRQMAALIGAFAWLTAPASSAFAQSRNAENPEAFLLRRYRFEVRRWRATPIRTAICTFSQADRLYRVTHDPSARPPCGTARRFMASGSKRFRASKRACGRRRGGRMRHRLQRPQSGDAGDSSGRSGAPFGIWAWR